MIKVGNDILIAERHEDSTYPGIYIYLVKQDGTKELVSMTEYNKEDNIIATYTYKEGIEDFAKKTIFKEVR